MIDTAPERIAVPPLVGRKQVCEILGVKSANLGRDVPELPPPLHERGIQGFDVSVALYPRSEILAIAKARNGKRKHREGARKAQVRCSHCKTSLTEDQRRKRRKTCGKQECRVGVARASARKAGRHGPLPGKASV